MPRGLGRYTEELELEAMVVLESSPGQLPGAHGGSSTATGPEPWVLTPAERERRILEHLPQVRLIARRIHERLPESVSIDDLISTGIVGLISAIDRFDPIHQVKLKTYAEYKIRGAILDSLRGLDWAPRQQRKRAKQIEAAISVAEQKLKRAPNEDEIATQLGLSIVEYHEWLVDIRGVNLGSLEASSGDDDGRDLLKYISDNLGNLTQRQFLLVIKAKDGLLDRRHPVNGLHQQPLQLGPLYQPGGPVLLFVGDVFEQVATIVVS